MRHPIRTPTGVAVWAVLLLAGCAAVQPLDSHRSGEGLPSPASTEAEIGVLALRAYSAGISTEGERIDDVPADVALFDDGLVVADIGDFPERRYVAVQLTMDEFDEYLSRIRAVNPDDLFVPYDPTFHSSSQSTLIRIQNGADDAEIVVVGLLSDVVEPADVPDFAIDIDQLISELKDLVVDEGEPYSGEVPTVPGVLPDLD